MPKYVVVGAGGQLARDLIPRLAGEVVGVPRSECDLTRPELMRAKLTELRPEVIFNCAAYNFVDRAESEPETAFAVNAWGVRHLAAICRDLSCVLVHYSTNYVFGLDHDRRTPYLETDLPGPVSAYGIGKLAGEYFARTICPKHFVIRTAGLFGLWGSGGKGGNFVELMLRLAREGKPIRVVNDQVCTPTSTVDLSEGTISLLQTGRYGLYQLTNARSCSWHQYAQTIFELAGVQANLKAVSSEEFGAPASRPRYSVMANAAYEALGLKPFRPWRDALVDYLGERRKPIG
ncbi:MAG TPA: dTDP-4-dehydrorhamnose reductase [Gemmataceae bacterium]|nr:dTDP-4-dehydrorhamnose reductase [Gemmataceae bacterium]